MSTLRKTAAQWLWIAGLLLPVTLASAESGPQRRPPLFPPGEQIAVGGSRTESQIGRTQDARAVVRGVVDAFGHGSFDLIVAPDRIYPFRRFDEHGAPVYEAPRTIDASGLGGLVTSHDGIVYGLRTSGGRIELLEFDRSALKFQPRAISDELKLPGGLSGALAGRLDANGRLDVYFGVHNSEGYHHPEIHHHRFEYVPFDGAGFWRGGLPRAALYHARFESTSLKKLASLGRAGAGSPEFLFDLRGMAILPGPESRQLSLITSEKLGVFRRFPLDPATGAPAKSEFVNGPDQVAVRHPVINPGIATFADPQSGRRAFIVSDTGRVWFYEATQQDGRIVCGEPLPVRAPTSAIALGALPVISPGDLDGDGRIDFLAGNDAGQLLFVKNIGEPDRPEFDEPVPVDVDGEPLDIKAGYRGSIQGPGEAMWGYTCPTVVDWNGDGKLDVILNSILADYMVLLQRPGSGPPRFTKPRPMYCDGLQLHLAWRSQPAICRWEHGGRLGMVCLDEQNLLRQFWRIDNQNVERGELLRFQDGSPINANVDEGAGQTGRAKLVPTDWDGDGALDLLVGTSRGLSIAASGTTFYPSSFGDTRQASVLLLRNAGTNAAPVFEYARMVEFNGERIRLGTHSCSPQLIDLGRGVRDILVAEESGGIRYFPAEGLAISKAAP
ncbi:FG-GAP repeat protein [Caulifigura coniformis]|uniref:FG-GAP repeat protein n=1 Tax=Caulifigura coniformis TaxID=2527983 RepID=A0A517SF46_9PLAN|nr:VCBS repeat-containing protein [Caulifigura coniformis]QDT54756.1 FG-GAP repeat protein [Caulifigura coniformis]